MKKCPFCAEEIQDAAIKCRYCGSRLDQVSTLAGLPTRPPATPSAPHGEFEEVAQREARDRVLDSQEEKYGGKQPQAVDRLRRTAAGDTPEAKLETPLQMGTEDLGMALARKVIFAGSLGRETRAAHASGGGERVVIAMVPGALLG